MQNENFENEITQEQQEILNQLEKIESPLCEAQELSKEEQQKEKEIKQKAEEQLSQIILFGIQNGARVILKNPHIVITKESQEAFKQSLPEFLEECEIQAPDFLSKYQARIGFGFACFNICTEIFAQQKFYKMQENYASNHEEEEVKAA